MYRKQNEYDKSAMVLKFAQNVTIFGFLGIHQRLVRIFEMQIWVTHNQFLHQRETLQTHKFDKNEKFWTRLLFTCSMEKFEKFGL